MISKEKGNFNEDEGDDFGGEDFRPKLSSNTGGLLN
jgi:hypothetical protein